MVAKPLPQGLENKLSLYDLFIGLMTVLSLTTMAAVFLFGGNQVVTEVLFIVDNLFCVIFLADFTVQFVKAPSKKGYMKWQGMMDLLGSLPGIPLLRLFRLFRLTRIARVLRMGGPRRIYFEFANRRSESALYVVITLALLVITFGSLGVYETEQRSPNPNITSGQDAVWWSVVTITTVGYGDEYPTTWPGRIIGMVIMFTGLGVFGVFTSFMANRFIAFSSDSAEGRPAPDAVAAESSLAGIPALENQVAQLSREIAELKAMLVKQGGTG